MSKQAQDQTSRNLLKAEVERSYKNAKVANTHWDISKIGNNYDEYSIYEGDTRIATAVQGKVNAELIAAAPETAAELDRLREAISEIFKINQKTKTGLFTAQTVTDFQNVVDQTLAVARAALNGDTTPAQTNPDYSILDEQDFSDTCSIYRHTPMIDQDRVVKNFESIKQFIRDNFIPKQ